MAVDVDGVRRSWTAVETDWDTTDHRVRSLPEADLHKRVNDEWSYVETLRHLVFVTDAWIRRTVLSATGAYHRLGLPPDGDVDVRPWGIEVTARPTFEEVMTVRADRLATVRRWSPISSRLTSANVPTEPVARVSTSDGDPDRVLPRARHR